MNQEIKNQAHKEFTKQFIDTYKIWDYYRDEKSPELEKEHLDFIDSLIDRTVQIERERIVGELKKCLLNRMMKYDSKDGYSTLHDEILEKVSNDVDDIFSIITNNSDINSNK